MSVFGYLLIFSALGFFGYQLGSLIHDIIKRRKKKATEPKEK